MHSSSVWHMRDCLERYLAERPPGTVLEVGCNSRVPEYRHLFQEIGWTYVGADLDEGPDVDVVLRDPYSWEIESDKFDAIVSGSMLEHNEMFWLSFVEMYRVLVPGGLMIHVAPSRGHEHWGPSDCWRFYRDGMRAVAQWAGFECLEATTDWSASDLAVLTRKRQKQPGWKPPPTRFPDSTWGDTVGVFRKPTGGQRPEVALRYARKMLDHWGEADSAEPAARRA
ncbi:MAG TPA: class I SAM-dependent methyltransferase [Hyphomicrobiales bacterium]|nr:class I SAM-dependent methyltransferase [Hyphomicrobiales bacterium]